MTDQLALLEPAPSAKRMKGEVIHGSADLDGDVRWRLKRWWRAGPEVCWVMLNPSTADAAVNDPTILRCIDFSRAWGYAGLTVVNLYPFRSPNPSACRKWADWHNNGPDWHVLDLLIRNLYTVAEEAQRCALTVAAWGAIAWDEDWVDQVVEEIQTTDRAIPIHCLGKTASGAPKHPLARGVHRVPDDQQPIIWRA